MTGHTDRVIGFPVSLGGALGRSLLLGLSLLCGVPAFAQTIEVGPGRAIRTPSAVPWASLKPGAQVVISAGTYTEPLLIGSQGSAAQPIVVRGEGAVIIENSILLEGARHVVLRNLQIQNAQHSGVIIRRGASFNTVENSVVRNSGLGIWIGDGAGGGHRLLNNTLHDTRTHGIAIDVVNAPAGEETLIAGNRIYRNVMHGMEINGNRYIIENNVVWENGIGLSGTSGIHVFAKDPAQGTGRFNIIRYNTVSGQKETTGQDGNGIQLDQWCDDNQVYFNVTFANDGAGIVLFDAANNIVANNTMYDNMRDSGRKHAYKADFVIASDYTKNVNHSFGNVVRNNVVYTVRPTNYSIYIDRFSARNTKEISNNVLFHADSTRDRYFWDGTKGRDIAAWNRLKPGNPDHDYDPMLADPSLASRDLAGGHGLKPKPGSPLANAGIAVPSVSLRDVAGVTLTRLPIGAFAVPSN